MPYKQLSDECLAQFFVEFRRLIRKGALSTLMHKEINLIVTAARNRGLSTTGLLKIYLEIPFAVEKKQDAKQV